MKNLIFDGNVMSYTNTTGNAIKSGDAVVLTEQIGVAMVDIAVNATGSVAMTGVYQFPKTTSQAWSQGTRLFWDSVAGKLTSVGTGNTPAGSAFQSRLANDTSGMVRLQSSAKRAVVQADSVAADNTALKADFNALLAKLKAAGLMANS